MLEKSRLGKITAIIPVRAGSSRCPNKNIRAFSYTNLLEYRIKILKQVPEIDNIIVSTNDPEMKNIALLHGAHVHDRPSKYCKTETTATELYESLSGAVNTPIMLYTHCVTPFVRPETYSAFIKCFRENEIYDSIVSCQNLKHFMLMNGKPLNYDKNNIPPSQFLPDIYSPTFGTIVAFTKDVRETKNLIGTNPMFYELSQLEGIDIDTPFDFLVAELLFKQGIRSDMDIHNYIFKDITTKTPLLFDCTLRDGGYVNKWNFTKDFIIDLYETVKKCGFDYFEIGFLKHTETNLGILKHYADNSCKLASMCLIDEADQITSKYDGLTMIRVLYNPFKTKLDKVKLQNIRDLIALGYEVTVNIAYIDRVSDQQIGEICQSIKDIPLKAIYLADTYGSLDEKTTQNILLKFKTDLDLYNSSTNIAFHAHDNKRNALTKSKVAIDFPVCMLDSTISGMGRGGGNLSTEMLFLELGKSLIHIIKHRQKYRDVYEKHGNINLTEVMYAVSSYYGIHPDYVKTGLENDLDFETLYDFLLSLKMNGISDYIPSLLNKVE
jgi:CMP-N-acetylneuraminic acid synthetase